LLGTKRGAARVIETNSQANDNRVAKINGQTDLHSKAQTPLFSLTMPLTIRLLLESNGGSQKYMEERMRDIIMII